MPSKKKKYNARFPAGRIKKIMQSDEEVGKVAQAVPVIISRTLELFVESLLTKTLKITNSRNAKTLSPSHMKQCIMAENRFDFLRELVKNIPDISVSEEIGQDISGLPGTPILESPPPPQQEPYDLSKPSTSCEINFPIIFSNTNSNGNTVIRNGNTSCSSNYNISSRINNTVTSNNNTIIGTNIPLPAHTTTTRNLTTLGPISTTQSPTTTLPNNSREELMRQWDTVSQIRQQMLSTIQSTTTPTTVPQQQKPTTTMASFYNTSNNNNNDRKTSNSTLITECNPPKLKRMDSLPISTTNININLDKKNRKLQHQPKSLPSTDLLSLQNNNNDNKLPPVPATIVNIDICNKPIIKIDYSNLNLHDNNDLPTSITSSNNNNKNNTDNTSNTSNLTKTTARSSYSNTNDLTTKKNSPVTTFNPIINIDLSKIATQPPTIHFNLGGNISSTSNINNSNSSSTKIDSKINTSAIRSSSLDLDEDYDNI